MKKFVITDTRFLTLHPRTALWWKQRKKCERCAHMERREGTAREASMTMMKCLVVKARNGDAACIGARDDGAECGPKARLFKAKK